MKLLKPSLFVVLTTALVAFAVACGGGSSSKTTNLGSVSANDHGTKDASSAANINLEVDDFYYNPTFIRGTPGEKIVLNVSNDSNTLHNFSLPGQQIDKDIPGKTQAGITVSLPDSGVLLFFCKYHTGQGMNGELLAGNAQPGPAPAAAASPAAGGSPAATAATTVKVDSNAALGKFLVDSTGRTLYMNKNDPAGASSVTGNTLNNWPPLSVPSGAPTKSSDAPGDITLITRDDGSKQVAYLGHPLYYYARDNAPGDTNGQAAANVWFVVAP